MRNDFASRNFAKASLTTLFAFALAAVADGFVAVGAGVDGIAVGATVGGTSVGALVGAMVGGTGVGAGVAQPNKNTKLNIKLAMTKMVRVAFTVAP